MALADLKNGVPIAFEIWQTLGNAAEVLVAMLGLRLLFKGVPHLSGVKALARYAAVAVFLAPLVSSLVGAIGVLHGDYWLRWRIWFLADALAFLTVTPAILSWAQEGQAWARKSRNYLELAALLTSLVLFAYFAFMGAGRQDSPALLYLLVPLLLWAALRLGLKGVSTAMLVVAFLSIWGAAHDRGPFTGQGPLNNAMSLQLFLFFATLPFLVLAALVEQETRAEQELRESEERSRRFVLMSPVAMVVTRGLEQRNELINEKFTALFGYSIEDVPEVAYWWSLAYPDQEYREAIKSKWQERIAGAIKNRGEIEPMEAQVRCKDGSFRYIEFHFTSLGDTDLVSFVDLTDRKKASDALRESEDRFRSVANTAPVLIWMSDSDRMYNYVNEPWLKFTGRTLETELGNGWIDGVHPEDLGMCLEIYTAAFSRREPFLMNYRLRRHDGEYRWIADHGVPRLNLDGSLAGYIGSCIDITEQKLAEEALSTVNRMLIQAQEEERTEIARELHDDISQRLALLAVNLDGLKHRLPASAADFTQEIGTVLAQVAELGSDVQTLSHRLHSSKLEVLGLAVAAAGFCSELADRQGVKIDFHSENVPKDLSREISICLFRVLQEALQNATKHSGSRDFQVWLKSGTNEIELIVQDSGIGFEPEEAIKGRGLGLTSMKERLNLVAGQLSIESNSRRGTSICARVPTGSKTTSAGAIE